MSELPPEGYPSGGHEGWGSHKTLCYLSLICRKISRVFVLCFIFFFPLLLLTY